jgi:hypothetical protein
MKPTRLWLATAVLFGALVVYNSAVQLMARKSQRGRLLHELTKVYPGTECVFLGNSLMEAGVDITAFRSAWPKSNQAPSAINLALGGTSPAEHSLILQRALQRAEHPKYVIYGFFDDQLTSPVQGRWSDLVGNRALSYEFPKQAAHYYSPGSKIRPLELGLIGHIPMLAERSMLWSRVELLRRTLGEIGLPRQKTNRYGRVQDFAALEPKNAASFQERCEYTVRARINFSAPVRDIIRNAQEHGATVILLEMPLPSRHRQVYYSSAAWLEMKRYLLDRAAEYHAAYLSAADWITDDNCFEDATHLNENGAQIFSRKLAEALSNRESN